MTDVDVPLDPATLAEPHALHRRLRDSGVAFDRRHGFWVVARYDDVAAVLRRHDDLSSEVGPLAHLHGDPARALMIAADAPRHTRLRAAVSAAFRPQAVARRAHRVDAIAHDLVRALPRTGSVDAVAALAEPLPVIVIAELLGVPEDERAAFKAWSDAFIDGLNRPDWATAIEPAWPPLRAWFADAIDARRSAPADDLVSDLAARVGEGPDELSRDEAIDLCALLLVAGNETTTNLIANTVAVLCDDRALQARLRARPGDVPGAIEEVLRWDSPVQALFRVARRRTDVGGRSVEGGDRVLVVFGSANRDERHFVAPETVDMDRSGPPHLAFGTGRHFCLGAHLARLEAASIVRALLSGTTWVSHDREATASRRATLVVRGWRTLPVVFDPPCEEGELWTSS